MRPTPRTLPAVIGSTENALRALLEQSLTPTPLDYQGWVTLNLVDRGPGDQATLVPALSSTLGIDVPTAGTVLRSLEARGFLAVGEDCWHLAPRGTELLGELRVRVGAASARVLEGIPDTDLATATRVLDQVRERAVAQRTGR